MVYCTHVKSCITKKPRSRVLNRINVNRNDMQEITAPAEGGHMLPEEVTTDIGVVRVVRVDVQSFADQYIRIRANNPANIMYMLLITT